MDNTTHYTVSYLLVLELLLVMVLSTNEVTKGAEKAAEAGVGRYGGDTATNTLLTSAAPGPQSMAAHPVPV